MTKPSISIKSLLAADGRRVAGIVAELEAPVETRTASWTERLSPSTKGGKDSC